MTESSNDPEVLEGSTSKTSDTRAEFAAFVERLKFKEQLNQIVTELSDSAKTGNAESFDLLVELAKNASFKVFEVSQAKPAIVRKFARKTAYWPILLSTSDKLNRDNALLVKQLELGAEFSSSISVEKTFKGDTPLRKVAVNLVYVTQRLRQAWDIREKLQGLQVFLQSTDGDSSPEVLEERRLVRSLMESASTDGVQKGRDAMSGLAVLASVLGTNPGNMNKVDHTQMMQAHALPPLSVESREQWFQFGLDILLLATDGEPETSPFLRNLGDYRKDKYPKLLVAMENGGEVVASEVLKIKRQGRAKKTAETNFWDGVTTKLRRVYEKVVSC